MLDKLSRYRISFRNKTVSLMTLDVSCELCRFSIRDVSTVASPVLLLNRNALYMIYKRCYLPTEIALHRFVYK